MQLLDKEEQQLLNLLPKGMDNPQPVREIVKITGWSSRKVRATIYRLIVIHHQPIGAVNHQPGNGYFIITNDQERRQALAPLTSQIQMMNKRAQAISKAKLGTD